LKITVAGEGVGCWVLGVGLRSENPKPKTQNLKLETINKFSFLKELDCLQNLYKYELY
jgi:hypothetical protein